MVHSVNIMSLRNDMHLERAWWDIMPQTWTFAGDLIELYSILYSPIFVFLRNLIDFLRFSSIFMANRGILNGVAPRKFLKYRFKEVWETLQTPLVNLRASFRVDHRLFPKDFAMTIFATLSIFGGSPD